MKKAYNTIRVNFRQVIGILSMILFSTNTFAYDVEIGGIYYNLNTNAKTAEVTYNDNTNSESYTGIVNIPSSITHSGITYKVNTIGKEAFRGCSVTSVTIPNSVLYLNALAFAECGSLTTIIIPNSVVSIYYNTFSNNNLSVIIVDSGNTVFDSRNNCNAIIVSSTNKLIVGCKSTIIPQSVTSIGNCAFYGCKGLTSIDIPNGITSIGDFAFSYCI